MSVVLNRDPEPDVALVIEIGSLCMGYHVLPAAGGLLDQDPEHVMWLQMYMAAIEERVQLERSRTSGLKRT
jgi:xanthosine utilization system XapX-like protein